MNFVTMMLEAAQKEGFKIEVGSDHCLDYSGTDAKKADEAVNAIDEAEVFIFRGGKRIGWALIVNGLDEDERIADTAYPWMNAWCEENVQ